MSEFLEISHVSRSFNKRKVLDNISFSFPRIGMYGIVGPSGSGKSTLLNIIAGLDNEYLGTARIGQHIFKNMNEDEVSSFRMRHVGFVFQSFNLLELDSVINNVLLILDSITNASKSKKRRKALDLLDFVGMRKKANRKVNTLSGGEKQRVAFTRALANDPWLLLADEPSGSLDEENSRLVFLTLKKISKDRLVVVVSHDESLLREHVDGLIRIQDGKVIENQTFNGNMDKINLPFYDLSGQEKSPKTGWGFFFRHAFMEMKNKKWRTLVSEASLSLSLCGLGLSAYISSSLSNTLNGVFSAMVDDNKIIMSPLSSSSSAISNVYSATLEQAQYIVDTYPEDILDYGTSFLMDFEDWFVDDNEIYCMSGSTKTVIPGLSARSINDYLWLDDFLSSYFYPSRPATMTTDQVILGLPYNSMFNLCYGLHILRNYQSLGDYIRDQGLSVILSLSNIDYGFVNEEIFEVLAIVETDYPCIIHSSHHWAHEIFIDQMRFRSSLTEETLSPQYIYEIPYLVPIGNPSTFLSESRKDENLISIVYEKPDSNYLQSVCPLGETCSVNRLYLYNADKNGLAWSSMDIAMEICPDIVGRSPSASGSYYANTSTVLSGFFLPFFLCTDEEKANEMIDACSDLPTSQAYLPVETHEGVKDGSYLVSASGGLRISSNLSNMLSGEAPASIEEAAISSSLAKEWDYPSQLVIAAAISEEEVGEKISRHFETAIIKITGVVDNDKDTLYVTSDWTIDFYFLQLGMSSFNLEPNSVTFYMQEGSDINEDLDLLSKKMSGFSFSYPAGEIASSIEDTIGYVATVLKIFSIISILMSSLLFLIVMSLTILESKNEARLFFTLGMKRGEIAKNYFAQCLIFLSMSLLSSIAIIAVSELMVEDFIASSFGSELSFSISFSPMLVMGVSALAFLGLLLLAVILYLHRMEMSKKE